MLSSPLKTLKTVKNLFMLSWRGVPPSTYGKRPDISFRKLFGNTGVGFSPLKEETGLQDHMFLAVLKDIGGSQSIYACEN